MNIKRHHENKNLTIYQGTSFNGVPLLPNRTYIAECLQATEFVINNAIREHPRTLAIRFDLHMPSLTSCPDYPNPYDSKVISTFIASLKAKFIADIKRKARVNTRVHPCTLRYFWVKEFSITGLPHYHVVIFLNNDTYNSIGNYEIQGSNNASRVIESWATALQLEFYQAKDLVHFPDKTPMYFLNTNEGSYFDVYFSLFKRLSYFAKVDTKVFGNGHFMGCSRS
jgi:hypothetical protein